MAAIFVNAKQFGATLAPLMPYEAEAIGQALGVTGLPDLFLAFAHDGKNACDVLELSLPGPTDGLLKALLAHPVSNRAAQWVRPNTALFVSLSLDSQALRAAGERLLASLPPAVGQQLDRALHQQGGNDVMAQVARVASVLGREVSIAFDLPQPLPPHVTFTAFVELRDQKGAEQMLQQLADSGRLGAVHTAEMDGVRMWSTDVTVEGSPISPTCAVRDGWLVFSNFRNVVERHLRAQDLGERSLANDPRFLAAARSAPDAALFVTGRVKTALTAYWGLVASVGIPMATSQLGFAPEEVPDVKSVSDALDDVVIAGSATADGFVLRVQQPLGFGALLPAAAGALDWLLTAVAGANGPAPAVGPTVKKIF
jgi:hypothetical protein